MAIVPNAAGGNWNTGATWVGGVAPTAADDVLITALTGTLTINGTSGTPSLCRSLDATACIGTLAQGSAAYLDIGDGTTGALLLVSGMTYAPNAASFIRFKSTTTGNNITTAAKRMGSLTFDGVGGAWTMQDACNNASGSTITLTNGDLDINGQTVGNTSGVIFSSSNSNTRSLTMGAGTWRLPGSSATVWDITNSSGMTLSAASSTINSLSWTSPVPIFEGGGLTYGTLTFTGITTGLVTINGANTFGTMTLSNGANVGNTTSGYFFGANQTVTGTFTSTGTTYLQRNFLGSSTIGTARTLSAGTFTITNTDLRDITKAGAGSGDISAVSSTTGNGDGGGNSGWTFSAVQNAYMVTAVSVNWTGSNWKTTSGGSTNTQPPAPLLHWVSIFDANSVTAGSRTITLDMPRIGAVNWTGVLNTPAWATSTAWTLYGSLTMVAGMTHSGGVTMTLRGQGSFTFDGGGLTWPSSGPIVNNSGPNATWTWGSNFTSSSNFTNTTGVISSAYTWSIVNYTQTGGTVTFTNQLLFSGTHNQSGGAFTTSGASGELKGADIVFSGGTSTLQKTTLTATPGFSSGSNITFPATSSMTWVGTCSISSGSTITYGGAPTFTTGSMVVGATPSSVATNPMRGFVNA